MALSKPYLLPDIGAENWTTRRTAERADVSPAKPPEIIPQHFPFANLIERQSLGAQQTRTISLRHERLPGRVESSEVGSNTARIMALVDGKRTVHEIADLLTQGGSDPIGRRNNSCFRALFQSAFAQLGRSRLVNSPAEA